MSNIKSSLCKFQSREPMSEEDLFHHAKRAYHQKRFVLVPLDEVTDVYFKQELINFANERYGKK